jgi:hypothetical protein
VGWHLVEVPGGLGSMWLCKSLMYSRISVPVLPSLPQLLCTEPRGHEGVICVAGAVSRILGVGSIAERGRVVVFPCDDCGQQKESGIGAM